MRPGYLKESVTETIYVLAFIAVAFSIVVTVYAIFLTFGGWLGC